MGWASLRNILTHFYPVIDLDKVYQALDEVDVLGEFLAWSEEEAGEK
jgi:uncharacterized protein YutE (UPF0331/DUF86 family)